MGPDTIKIRFLDETDYKEKRRLPGDEMDVTEEEFADLIEKNINIEKVDGSMTPPTPPTPPAPPAPPMPPPAPANEPEPVPVKPEKNWVGGHTVPA